MPDNPEIMFDVIPIIDYSYHLPDERIAKFPLDKRDQSKLLVMSNGLITKSNFHKLSEFIPENSLFIFNNTRVIKARLVFNKPGGARIEIFCLNEESHGDGYAVWKCYVGNSKKWKNQELIIQHADHLPVLNAVRESTDGDTHLIRLSWDNSSLLFSEILELYGKVPLPPYLNREPIAEDTVRYQTIYALYDGSVAAPTAGLHFTDTVFENLIQKKCTLDYVTLHVGAGTFKPVTVENALEHSMHEEKVILHLDTLLRLIQNLQQTIVSVGTTSMRSLESIYWLGYQLLNGSAHSLEQNGWFSIEQWEPYNAKGNISSADALTAVYDYMRSRGLKEISGYTRIMIIPGYTFRIVNALITNFHQPQSTLLLLVAAFTGSDWKKAYDFALENNYRFLSYGDSCLFFRADRS